MKLVVLTEPIFHSEITFFYGTLPDVLTCLGKATAGHPYTAIVEAFRGPTARAGGKFICAENTAGQCFYAIWINTQQPKKDRVHAVWHEALHATMAIMRQKGVEATVDGEETYCYFQSWLAGAMLEAMNG